MEFVEIEQTGKRIFEQFPVVKKLAKRVYQIISVVTSKEKFKSEGNIVRISPDDEYEYFYGYYDKSPWDKSDRYMICLKVKQTYKSVAPKEPGIVGVIDTQSNNKFKMIGTTHSWNVQQGCMAQWMGPDFESKIIYNDFREGNYCSVIYDFKNNKEEKILPMAVYDVAKDGSFILSLDFSRLHRMRPGYGYSNLPDTTKEELCPEKGCIWKVNVETGEVTELFKYTDFANFEPNESMVGAEHKVNHLMISPNCKRVMILHRWFQKGRKHTRLVTVNIDKTEMYNLSDNVFVSHCYWKNDEEILSFLRKNDAGDHYYLMKDKTQEYKMYWPELKTDGHCSYSPNRKYVITDTYPNRKRIASVYLCTEISNQSQRIARVYSPFKYDNDCRCDLHPRWNRKGDKVCIDSVHNGKRGLFVIDLTTLIMNNEKKELVNEKIKKVAIIRSNKFKLIAKEEKDIFYVEDMFSELNKVNSLIRDICLYGRLRISSNYYNKKLVSLDTDTIIIFDPHVRIQFLKWLVMNNPDKRIILWFWNTIKEIGKNIPLDKIPESIELWSYSIYDCEKYGLKYNTTFYPYEIRVHQDVEEKYDVCFVGKDKGRLEKILEIKEALEKRGLKTYFHISPTHQYELRKKSVYKPKIAYSDVDNIISKSRCILDCEVDSFAGPTIRPLEAIYRRKKLISNNQSLRNEDYYNSSNIFIYGKDDIDKIIEFIEKPYEEYDKSILKKYSMREWVKRFFKE